MSNINIKIPIKNIFYMLCYAWNLLDITKDRNVGIDNYDEDIYNLLSRVFAFGLKRIIKSGFNNTYIHNEGELTSLRGKINIYESIKLKLSKQGKLYCEYDEYSSNNLFNQIIKFTINKILVNKNIDKIIKQDLRNQLIFFNNIEEKPPTNNNLRLLVFNQNNINYKLIICIATLIYNNIPINEDDEAATFKDFYREESMQKVYELFLLNFYKMHLDRKKYKVHAPKIKWNIDENIVKQNDDEFNIITDISDRRTDIVIENNNLNLQMILDAKYYKKTLTEAYMNSDKERPWVNNIYQIRGYVLDSKWNGGKLGSLIYPTVEKAVNNWYPIQDTSINIQTINLNQDWKDIENDLFNILENLEKYYIKLMRN